MSNLLTGLAVFACVALVAHMITLEISDRKEQRRYKEMLRRTQLRSER